MARALRGILLKWLPALLALLALGWGLYVGVRFHHLENHVYRWMTGADSALSAWNSPQQQRQGLDLPDYRMDIAGRPVDGVERDLSGLAYDAAQHRLLAVTKKPERILALDLDGRLLAEYPVANVSDPEGIAWLGGRRVAVTDERDGRIVVLTLPVQPRPLDADQAPSLQLNLGDDRNHGLEGLGYDRKRDRLYVVKEHSPPRLYRITGLGGLAKDKPVPHEPVLRIEDLSAWLRPATFATDLASVEFDPQSGHLLLLSEESHMILEIDAEDGSPFSLRALGSLPGDEPVVQPEGLAVDERGTIYVVSEPNLFYRLRKP